MPEAANKYVIVGNGMAGVTAAQNIRRLDPDSSLTIIQTSLPRSTPGPGLMYHMMGTLKEWDLRIAKDEGYYRSIGAALEYDTALRIQRQ